MRFTLMDQFGWDMEYTDSMRLWEFEIYLDMLKHRVEKEEQERKNKEGQ